MTDEKKEEHRMTFQRILDLEARVTALEARVAVLESEASEARDELDRIDPRCEGRCTARKSECERLGQCCSKCTHR